MVDALERTDSVDGLSIALLERAVAALESIAESLQQTGQQARRRTSEERSELELQAMVLLSQQDATAINVSQIADQLNVTRQSLHRLPMFKRQLDEMRRAARRTGRQRSGFKTSTGDVEAVD